MGKGKGLTFTLFAALGAFVGYASYMAKQNEFSEDTKDKYDTFISKAKNVGTDLKRTYTSIGDKSKFTASTKNLSESTKKLASKATDLVVSATNDMYNNVKSYVSEAISNAVLDFDDYETPKKSIKKTKAVKKSAKKTTKTTKKKK
jgi:hypothetical protein